MSTYVTRQNLLEYAQRIKNCLEGFEACIANAGVHLSEKDYHDLTAYRLDQASAALKELTKLNQEWSSEYSK